MVMPKCLETGMRPSTPREKPVCAPWIFAKTLRGGYVTSCGMEEELMRVSIDDSYREDALHLDIWFDEANKPKHAEILWKDRRILSLEVKEFEFL